MTRSRMRNVYISGVLSLTPVLTIILKTNLAPGSGLVPTELLSAELFESASSFAVAAAILSSLLVQLGFALHILGVNERLNLVGRIIWLMAILACMTPIATPLYWYLHVFEPYRTDYNESRRHPDG